MVLPVPKRHTSHMGQNPPHYNPLPNPDELPTDWDPKAVNSKWWEYLEAEDEDDYNHEMQNLKRIREQDGANLDIYYTDDDSSAFFGCTYDEIIAMYENGVVIPTEVLNWAQSMAQNDVSSETVTVQADDAEALYLSLKQSPNVNLKTIVQIFADKCKEHEQELDAYGEELTSLLKDVGVMRNKIEMLKEDAQKETEPLKDEWEDISYKLSHGIELTPKEQERAQYLKGKFGEIDANFRSQISSEIANIGIYLDKIGEVSQKIEIANSYSRVSKTILDEMSNPEASNASAGMITGSDLETEETLNNEDINANFTTTLHNAVYAMDNSVTNTGNISDSVMNILEESAEIGGFQLDDPDHTVTTSFSEDIDLSILEDNNNPKSGDPEETGDKGGDPNPPRGGEPTDNDNPEVIPEETPTGDTPDAGNPTNGTTPTGGTPDAGNPTNGTNPTGGTPDAGNPTNGTDPTGNTPPTNGTTGGGEYGYATQPGETQTGNNTDENKPKDDKSEDKDDEVDVDGTRSQTEDVKSQTKATRVDASTSSNHKTASKENEKKVIKELKALQKENKKYYKKLDTLQKNIETLQQEIEEDDARIGELHSTAENIQAEAGNEEDNDKDIQEELAPIALEMMTIASETEEKTGVIDKTIKTQKTDRKKVINNSQKMEKTSKSMKSIGTDYQGTNDTIQTTAKVVNSVSSTVTDVGEFVEKTGKTDLKLGKFMVAIAKPLLSNPYTAAEGGAKLAIGNFLIATGTVETTVGNYAEVAGTIGSTAAETTTQISSDVRTSIDSFTETSNAAQGTSKGINKEAKKSQDDIKAANKDNTEMKKKIAEFQAQAMDVATMGGGGAAAQLQNGGNGEAGAAPAMSATGGAGVIAENPNGKNNTASGNVLGTGGGTDNESPVASTGTTPDTSFGAPGGLNGNEPPEEGANPPEENPAASTGTTPDASFGAPGGVNGNETPEKGAVPQDEEPKGERDADMPDFEDMTVELTLDDEQNPEFAYIPEFSNGNNRLNSNSPSEKPYIKAPEEVFNQSPNNRKKR